MSQDGSDRVPVTYDHCDHIGGPFFHGTRSAVEIGDELVAGRGSNFQEGRVSNNIYFTALVDTAVWGAELATAQAGTGERGHVYVVEPAQQGAPGRIIVTTRTAAAQRQLPLPDVFVVPAP